MKLRPASIVFAVLLIASLIGAAWSYKGQDFGDNQVVVFITGSELLKQGGVPGLVSLETLPELKPGSTVDVPVDGVTTPCQLSAFDKVSTASGGIKAGRLTNGVQLQESQYIELADHTKANSRNWGTNELVNSLELAGCAVSWKTHVAMQVNDLSSQNGGYISPHKSHQRGLDADVPLLCKDGVRYYSCGQEPKFDREASWIFVKALASRTAVQMIFLKQSMIDKLRSYADQNEPDYKLRQAVFSSLLVADSTHYSHFHVRLHCSSGDTAAGCVEQKGGFRGSGALEPAIDDEDNEGADPEVSSAAGSGNGGGSGASSSASASGACTASDKLLSSSTDPTLAFMDGLKIFIPSEASCGGTYSVIVQLGGINQIPSNLFIGSGGRGMEQTLKQDIASGGQPVIIVEPVDVKAHSNELWAARFDYATLMNLVRNKLQENRISIQDVSVLAHSGAGCDLNNGVYKIIKTEKNLHVVGLEDTCYGKAYADTLTRDLPASTVLISVNNGNNDPAVWKTSPRDFTGFENELNIKTTLATCGPAYAYCKVDASGKRLSFQKSGASHYDVPKILLAETLSAEEGLFPRRTANS